jgi:hypothetical protein
MANLGTYTPVKLAGVRGNAKKSADLLRNQLPQVHVRDLMVIFLGETHENSIDRSVISAVLDNLPIANDKTTRVIFERELRKCYTDARGATIREEKFDPDHPLPIAARNAVIGDMVIDACAKEGMSVVYIVCGSEHARPIFDYMNKKMDKRFTYISKLSDTDKDEA